MEWDEYGRMDGIEREKDRRQRNGGGEIVMWGW